ncbi:hypothetical protein ACA910_002593 [Epithemia clementina (nom. ined.)]
MCYDQEASSECEKANWEISDMQQSLSALVGICLEKSNMTAPQLGYVRSLLSLALEDEKPEGDCSNGLATTTRMRDHPNKCFSPELLTQCANVRDTVNGYQEGVPMKLEAFFYDPYRLYDTYTNQTYFQRSIELGLVDSDGVIIDSSVKEFVEIVRFRSSVKTARIRCASYDATTEEIQQAAAFSASSWPAMGVTVIAVALSCIMLQ